MLLNSSIVMPAWLTTVLCTCAGLGGKLLCHHAARHLRRGMFCTNCGTSNCAPVLKERNIGRNGDISIMSEKADRSPQVFEAGFLCFGRLRLLSRLPFSVMSAVFAVVPNSVVHDCGDGQPVRENSTTEVVTTTNRELLKFPVGSRCVNSFCLRRVLAFCRSAGVQLVEDTDQLLALLRCQAGDEFIQPLHGPAYTAAPRHGPP